MELLFPVFFSNPLHETILQTQSYVVISNFVPENAGVMLHFRPLVGPLRSEKAGFRQPILILSPLLGTPKAYINSILKKSMVRPGWGTIGNSGRELTRGCYALKQKYHLPYPPPPALKFLSP